MVKMMVHMMKVMLMMICSKRVTHCSRIAVLFVIQSHVQNTAGVLILIDDINDDGDDDDDDDADH